MKLNRSNIYAAIRTAGALMLGNSVVGYLVLEKTSPKQVVDLVMIAILGLAVIIGASIEGD